jgi:hypothetical protein
MEAKVIELQEFVSQALIQIIAGVKQAQTTIGKNGGEINPLFRRINPNDTHLIGWSGDANIIDVTIAPIEFDLALTTSVGDGTKAGIGVFSGLFGAGVQSQMSNTELQLSRIKFSVPISLPIHGYIYPRD